MGYNGQLNGLMQSRGPEVDPHRAIAKAEDEKHICKVVHT